MIAFTAVPLPVAGGRSQARRGPPDRAPALAPVVFATDRSVGSRLHSGLLAVGAHRPALLVRLASAGAALAGVYSLALAALFLSIPSLLIRLFNRGAARCGDRHPNRWVWPRCSSASTLSTASQRCSARPLRDPLRGLGHRALRLVFTPPLTYLWGVRWGNGAPGAWMALCTETFVGTLIMGQKVFRHPLVAAGGLNSPLGPASPERKAASYGNSGEGPARSAAIRASRSLRKRAERDLWRGENERTLARGRSRASIGSPPSSRTKDRPHSTTKSALASRRSQRPSSNTSLSASSRYRSACRTKRDSSYSPTSANVGLVTGSALHRGRVRGRARRQSRFFQRPGHPSERATPAWSSGATNSARRTVAASVGNESSSCVSGEVKPTTWS